MQGTPISRHGTPAGSPAGSIRRQDDDTVVERLVDAWRVSRIMNIGDDFEAGFRARQRAVCCSQIVKIGNAARATLCEKYHLMSSIGGTVDLRRDIVNTRDFTETENYHSGVTIERNRSRVRDVDSRREAHIKTTSLLIE